MSRVRVSDIRSELRPSAQLLKLTYTASSGPAFERFDRQCTRKYQGKWRSCNTLAEEKAIVRDDGRILRILVARSEKREKKEATGLLWLHDGGFAYGVPEQESILVDMLCGDGSCVAVLPDYTKSTETPYPAALEDCYRILLWMKDNADELGINRSQLFVGGPGAGGGLAAAICMRARDVGDVRVAFQMTVAPMLDDRMESESSRDNNAPVWDSRKNRAAWDLYLRDMKEEIPVYAAPGRETDLSGMPPACGLVGDLDPLKDETVLYFAKMKKAGVPVSLRVYHGCFHSFETTAVASNVAMNAQRYLIDSFKYAQKHYFAHNAMPEDPELPGVFAGPAKDAGLAKDAGPAEPGGSAKDAGPAEPGGSAETGGPAEAAAPSGAEETVTEPAGPETVPETGESAGASTQENTAEENA